MSETIPVVFTCPCCGGRIDFKVTYRPTPGYPGQGYLRITADFGFYIEPPEEEESPKGDV